MTKNEFREWAFEQIRILDGATGTQLQKAGMPIGVCPEKWVSQNPETIIKIQKEYIESGSEIIYTCTLGGNGLKLKESGVEDAYRINKELAELSKKAAGSRAFVAGDIAPTGQLMEPFGTYTFEEIVDVYKEQVNGLLDGGVDLFVIETMMDIQEARAALLAVKETCDLPVMVTMTFERGGHTINGTDPLTALVTLQSLGADAVGCNCSTGPEQMLEIIKKLKPFAKVPLVAKPNAGMPKLVNGVTVFDMGDDEFAGFAQPFIEAGVNIIGGCCGTSPAYIEKVSKIAKGRKGKGIVNEGSTLILSSSRKTVTIERTSPICVIGERINPTGKKRLRDELRKGSMDLVTEYAMDQVDEGAQILDVNAGAPGIDEAAMLFEITKTLSTMIQTPLCLDSSSPKALEQALRIYPGRALINSISGEQIKLDKILPVAAKYGAAFILLPLDDNGVPETAEDRIEIIKKVYEKVKQYGYTKDDILVDGMLMTIASNQSSSLEALKVIKWCNEEFYANTVMGLSNISFGLPERTWINAAFLAMAASCGLSCAIMNPGVEALMHIKRASDALTSKDINSIAYIKTYSKNNNGKTAGEQHNPLYYAVVDGSREEVISRIKAALNEGTPPAELVDNYLIPAITYVGELYQKGKYFLPQLIQSAEAMKSAMSFLQPYLETESAAGKKGRIILATVKGDIHDIGKNIVGLMLKNYGFEVFDLGKDVPCDEIINKVREVDADIIALSALMTTTMEEMRIVAERVKSENLQVKIIVGGAAVDQNFAVEIGADAYAADAYAAVKEAERLTGCC
jgi:5-methyltetrahydrofolate--homocysteine methyltransferase